MKAQLSAPSSRLSRPKARPKFCEHGGIARRERLKPVWRNPYRLKSGCSHQGREPNRRRDCLQNSCWCVRLALRPPFSPSYPNWQRGYPEKVLSGSSSLLDGTKCGQLTGIGLPQTLRTFGFSVRVRGCLPRRCDATGRHLSLKTRVLAARIRPSAPSFGERAGRLMQRFAKPYR